MAVKFGPAVLLLVSVWVMVPAARAQTRLAITSGGERIIDRDPLSAAGNCGGWTYGPSPVVGDDGELSAVYVVSDDVANHCKNDLTSEQRFGDRIKLHRRASDGTWDSGTTVLSRADLSWMNDSEFLLNHPETFAGHFSSPAVTRIGGRWYMAFTASVNDRNLCAGEHSASNGCGSCRDPWSYFVVMWAASDDGVHWKVRERDFGDAMLIGRPPAENDAKPGSVYKGVTRVSLVTREENGQTWFYVAGLYWSPTSTKNVLFRIRHDPSDPWGLAGDPEIYRQINKSWVSCPAQA